MGNFWESLDWNDKFIKEQKDYSKDFVEHTPNNEPPQLNNAEIQNAKEQPANFAPPNGQGFQPTLSQQPVDYGKQFQGWVSDVSRWRTPDEVAKEYKPTPVKEINFLGQTIRSDTPVIGGLLESVAEANSPTTSEHFSAPIRDLPVIGTASRLGEALLNVAQKPYEAFGEPAWGLAGGLIQEGFNKGANLFGLGEKQDIFAERFKTAQNRAGISDAQYNADPLGSLQEIGRAMSRETPQVTQFAGGMIADPLNLIPGLGEAEKLTELRLATKPISEFSTLERILTNVNTLGRVNIPANVAEGELLDLAKLGVKEGSKLNPFEWTAKSKSIDMVDRALNNFMGATTDMTPDNAVRFAELVKQSARDGKIVDALKTEFPDVARNLQSFEGQRLVGALAELNTDALTKASAMRQAVRAAIDAGEKVAPKDAPEALKIAFNSLTREDGALAKAIRAGEKIDVGKVLDDAAKAQMWADVSKQIGNVAMNSFGLKQSDNVAVKMRDALKTFEANIFLGMNPPALVQNFLNNKVMTGIHGLPIAGQVKDAAAMWKSWGYNAMPDIVRAATGKTSNIVGMGIETGRKSWNPIMKLWEKAESAQHADNIVNATYYAYKDAMRQTAKGMPRELRAALSSVNPRLPAIVEGAVASGYTKADVIRALQGRTIALKLDAYIDDFAKSKGISPESARAMIQQMNVEGVLNMALAKATTPDEFRQTGARILQQVTERVQKVAGEKTAAQSIAESKPLAKVVITNADDAALKNLGYTAQDIYKMRPEDAQKIVAQGTRATPAPELGVLPEAKPAKMGTQATGQQVATPQPAPQIDDEFAQMTHNEASTKLGELINRSMRETHPDKIQKMLDDIERVQKRLDELKAAESPRPKPAKVETPQAAQVAEQSATPQVAPEVQAAQVAPVIADPEPRGASLALMVVQDNLDATRAKLDAQKQFYVDLQKEAREKFLREIGIPEGEPRKFERVGNEIRLLEAENVDRNYVPQIGQTIPRKDFTGQFDADFLGELYDKGYTDTQIERLAQRMNEVLPDEMAKPYEQLQKERIGYIAKLAEDQGYEQTHFWNSVNKSLREASPDSAQFKPVNSLQGLSLEQLDQVAKHLNDNLSRSLAGVSVPSGMSLSRDDVAMAIRATMPQLSASEAQTYADLYDAMAGAWAQLNGKNKAEWYSKIAGIDGGFWHKQTGRAELLQQGARGAVSTNDDARVVISFFENANKSTPVHEIAHVGRRQLNRMDNEIAARWAGAPIAENADGFARAVWSDDVLRENPIVNDYARLGPNQRKQMLATETDEAKRAAMQLYDQAVTAEEKFAKGFELYFREGKFPENASEALKQVFDKIKGFILEVYDSLRNFAGIEISGEMRGVYDRMVDDWSAQAARRDVWQWKTSELAPELQEEMRREAYGMLSDLRSGEKGARIHIGSGTEKEIIGVPSTYPKWYSDMFYKDANGKSVSANYKTVERALEAIVNGKEVRAPKTGADIQNAILESLASGSTAGTGGVYKSPPHPQAMELFPYKYTRTEIDDAYRQWAEAGMPIRKQEQTLAQEFEDKITRAVTMMGETPIPVFADDFGLDTGYRLAQIEYGETPTLQNVFDSVKRTDAHFDLPAHGEDDIAAKLKEAGLKLRDGRVMDEPNAVKHAAVNSAPEVVAQQDKVLTAFETKAKELGDTETARIVNTERKQLETMTAEKAGARYEPRNVQGKTWGVWDTQDEKWMTRGFTEKKARESAQYQNAAHAENAAREATPFAQSTKQQYAWETPLGEWKNWGSAKSKVPVENHRVFVEEALRDGKTVPENVLRDYPDLAAKYAKSTPAAIPTEQAAQDVVKVADEIAQVPVEDLTRDIQFASMTPAEQDELFDAWTNINNRPANQDLTKLSAAELVDLEFKLEDSGDTELLRRVREESNRRSNEWAKSGTFDPSYKPDVPVQETPTQPANIAAKQVWEMTPQEYVASPRSIQMGDIVEYNGKRYEVGFVYGDRAERWSYYTSAEREGNVRLNNLDEAHSSANLKVPVSDLKIIERAPANLKEHARAVENALAHGANVPQEVLNNYPDIAAKYGKRATPVAQEADNISQKSKEFADYLIKQIQSGEEKQADIVANLEKNISQAKHNIDVRTGMGAAEDGIVKVSREQLQRDEYALSKVREIQPAAVAPVATERAVAATPQTYSLDIHKENVKKLIGGEMTADEWKRQYEIAKQNIDAVKAELMQQTNAELKKVVGYNYRNSPKAQMVDSIAQDMLSGYNLNRGYQWQPMSEKLSDAIDRAVATVTDADIAKYVEARSARIAEQKKFLTNPETLSEFENFIAYRGKEKLTPEMAIKYDELKAAATRGAREVQAQRAATVTGTKVENATGKIIEGKHGKTGETLHIVQLEGERMPAEQFKELAGKARQLQGNYVNAMQARMWKTTPGFQFKTRENADNFLKLMSGESVDRTAQVVARAEEKQVSAAGRMKALADRLEEGANAKLNQERNVNTARRARMADSADAAARSDVALAKTIRNLADAIDAGEITHLKEISSRTQVETIDYVLRDAKRNFEKANGIDYQKSLQRIAGLEDVAYAKYPYPYIQNDVARTLPEDIKGKKGFVRDAEIIAQRYGRGDGISTITNPQDIERVEKLAKELKGASSYSWVDSVDHYKRMRAMGIETEEELRAALREYLQFKEGAAKVDPVQKLIREQIGAKDNLDFFSTPTPLADKLAEVADVKPGMRVLEPSAGQGHIADAIKRAEPGAKIDTVELASQRAEVLRAKGYEVVGGDYTEFAPAQKYDRIVMNPPFSNNKDVEHVRKAYDELAPGGRLVAITSEHPFFAEDAKSKEFRQWLDSVRGTGEKLPEGSFKTSEQPTGVATRLVIIDKPVDAPKYDQGDVTNLYQMFANLKEKSAGIYAYEYADGDVVKARGMIDDAIEKLKATSYTDNPGAADKLRNAAFEALLSEEAKVKSATFVWKPSENAPNAIKTLETMLQKREVEDWSDIERAIMDLSGDANVKMRQQLMKELTGEDTPRAKSGVNAVRDAYKTWKENPLPAKAETAAAGNEFAEAFGKRAKLRGYDSAAPEFNIVPETVAQRDALNRIFEDMPGYKKGSGVGVRYHGDATDKAIKQFGVNNENELLAKLRQIIDEPAKKIEPPAAKVAPVKTEVAQSGKEFIKQNGGRVSLNDWNNYIAGKETISGNPIVAQKDFAFGNMESPIKGAKMGERIPQQYKISVTESPHFDVNNGGIDRIEYVYHIQKETFAQANESGSKFYRRWVDVKGDELEKLPKTVTQTASDYVKEISTGGGKPLQDDIFSIATRQPEPTFAIGDQVDTKKGTGVIQSKQSNLAGQTYSVKLDSGEVVKVTERDVKASAKPMFENAPAKPAAEESLFNAPQSVTLGSNETPANAQDALFSVGAPRFGKQKSGITMPASKPKPGALFQDDMMPEEKQMVNRLQELEARIWQASSKDEVARLRREYQDLFKEAKQAKASNTLMQAIEDAGKKFEPRAGAQLFDPAEMEKARYSMLPELITFLSSKVGTDSEIAKGMKLDATTRKMLDQWLAKDVMPAMTDARIYAGRIGKVMERKTLLNYNARTNFDDWLGWAMPFAYFPRATATNLMETFINKPALAAQYVRLRQAMQEVENEPGTPERFKGKIRIPAPFLPKWMDDGVFVDPLSDLLPVERFINAPRRLAYSDVTDSDVANQIRKMSSTGEITIQDAENAIRQRGAMWNKVKESLNAQRGGTDAMDIGSMFTSFHFPIDWAHKLLSGNPEDISTLLPASRQIKGGTAVLREAMPQLAKWIPAGGFDPEGTLREKLGVPKGDAFELYHIDRALMAMAMDGSISERQAKQAMLERKGLIYDTARQRAAVEQGVGTVGSYLGAYSMRGGLEGEQQANRLTAQLNNLVDSEITRLGFDPKTMTNGEKWDQLRAFKATGEGSAIQKFYDAHPEYAVKGQLYKEQEQRLQDWLTNEFWSKYNDLSTLDKRVFRSQADAEMTKFLDSATRDYKAVPLLTLEKWVTALRGYVPETSGVMMKYTPAQLAETIKPFAQQDPAISKAYSEWTQRYAAIKDVQEQYYALAEKSKARADFLKAHPELVAYWDWNKQFEKSNPKLVSLLDQLRGKATTTNEATTTTTAKRTSSGGGGGGGGGKGGSKGFAPPVGKASYNNAAMWDAVPAQMQTILSGYFSQAQSQRAIYAAQYPELQKYLEGKTQAYLDALARAYYASNAAKGLRFITPKPSKYDMYAGSNRWGNK